MLIRHLFGEPRPPVGACPGEQVLHKEHSYLTAKPMLSSSCGPPPPHPARAVLPGTRYPHSNSSGPPCPARAQLPGTAMPMSSSSGPTRPLEHLLTGTYASQWRGLPKEMPVEHIYLKIYV
jgi:hypothetical protein